MASKHEPNKNLIKRIKLKFYTIKNFVKLTGLDESKVRVNLYRANEKAIAYQSVMEQKLVETPKPTDFKLSEVDRDKIRGAIYEQYKSVRGLTKAHPQFSGSWISYLLGTGGGIKYKKSKVEELLHILKID